MNSLQNNIVLTNICILAGVTAALLPLSQDRKVCVYIKAFETNRPNAYVSMM